MINRTLPNKVVILFRILWLLIVLYLLLSSGISQAQTVPFSDTANRPENINVGTVIETSSHGYWKVMYGSYEYYEAGSESVYVYNDAGLIKLSYLTSGVTFTVQQIIPAKIDSVLRPMNMNPGTILLAASGDVWKIVAGSYEYYAAQQEQVVIYIAGGKTYMSFGTSGAVMEVLLVSHGNNPPTANNQSVSTSKNTPKAITLTATDPDGDLLAYSIVSWPSHGTLSGTPPNVSYAPGANYMGPDSFTFKANDGKVDSNIATVSITVSETGKNPLNDTMEFVRQQYRDFLNREADAGGLAHWVNEIDSGAMTRAEVIESFFWSEEFGARIAPIVRLYFAYFLRIPDYDGLMYWVDASSQGVSLWAISDFFAGSEEFQQRYGSLSNDGFVNLIYHNILGRSPDSGGYAYWLGELNSGRQTRGQVMVGFSESNEYKSASSNEVFVTMMYVGMLRRSPEQEGFDYWVDQLDSGGSGLALIDGFLNSQEYASRFQ